MTTSIEPRPPLDWRKIEMVEPEMIEFLRSKTITQRAAMVFDANNTMRSLIAGRLQTEHPDWTADEIRNAVARRMQDAATHPI